MRVWLAVAMMCAVALAGCAGDDPSPEPTDDTPQPKDVKTTRDKGAISGVVVDETIAPIFNATITVTTTKLTAVTGADGAFVFEDLEPGLYVLHVSAPGYLDAQTTADVKAGEVAKPRVVLGADLSPVPFEQTIYFKGFMTLHLSFASFVVEVVAPGTGGCTCAFMHEPDPGAVTFIYEAYGDPSIASNPLPVYGDVYWELISQDNPETSENEYEIHSSHGKFPIYTVQPVASYPPAAKEWNVRLTGSQWFHYQEDFELFLTTFYHEEAPEGWTIQDASP